MKIFLIFIMIGNLYADILDERVSKLSKIEIENGLTRCEIGESNKALVSKEDIKASIDCIETAVTSLKNEGIERNLLLDLKRKARERMRLQNCDLTPNQFSKDVCILLK